MTVVWRMDCRGQGQKEKETNCVYFTSQGKTCCGGFVL